MTMLPDGQPATGSNALQSVTGLERAMRSLSILTMFMTLPQVLTVWVGSNTGGVSLVSWASYLISACLWLVYGVRKNDKTIYLPCIGWILLDGAIVVGIIFHA